MSNVRKIFLLAIVTRIVIASFIYHPDVKTQYFHAQFLSSGITNIYKFLDLKRTSLPMTDIYPYPPLIYVLQGFWYPVAHLVVGEPLKNWLWDWSEQALNHTSLYASLLILKLPYFVFDIATLLLLKSLIRDSNGRLRLLLFWAFNPISLYAIYAMGQFDIIPALLTLIALIMIKAQKAPSASLALGVATALKTYPAILFPFVFLSSKNPKQVFWSICYFLLGWLGPQAAFFLTPGYQKSVWGSGLAARLLVFSLDLGPIHVPVYILLYLILLGLFLYMRSRIKIEWFFMSSLLLIYPLIRFHLQWAIWVLPFITLYLARIPKLFLTVSMWILSLFGLFLLIPDKYVFLGLFSAIQPYLVTVPPLSEILAQLGLNVVFIQYFLRFFLGISSSWIIIATIKNTNYQSIFKINRFHLFIPVGIFAILVLTFISAHLLIRRIPDVAQRSSDRLVPIYSGHPVSQTITPRNSGLSTAIIYLRNGRLLNTDPLLFTLSDSRGNIVRSINISGRNVGDGETIRFQFDPIQDSANQSYSIQLNAPDTPLGSPMVEAGFSNGDSGQLSYELYYRPSNSLSIINNSLNHFISGILDTRYILVVVLSLSCLYVISLRSSSHYV